MTSVIDSTVLTPTDDSRTASVRESSRTVSRSALRVAHLLGGREGGGITTAIASLLRGFPEQNVDPSVVILRSQPRAGDARLETFDPVYLAKSRGKIGTARRVARYCAENGIDILHTHSISSNLHGRLAGLINRQTKVVTTVHANTADELKGTFGPGWLEWLISRADFQMHRGSDQLIAVSGWLKDALVRRGLRATKVHAIGHGIDVEPHDSVTSRQTELRSGLAIPDDHLIVGIVGRLTPVKNHTLFLKMAQAVRERRGNVTFLIVGDGPLRAGIQQQIRDLGLTDNIRLTGWVDDAPAYFKLIDVLVSSSDSEGFGYVVLEGMASGTAVVATAVSEIPNIIHNGRTGLLTPPGDVDALLSAVQRLLDDRGLRTSMGAAARLAVLAQFSLQREVEQHLQVYSLALGGAAS